MTLDLPEPPGELGPAEPVRDLEPRRRWLFLALVVATLVVEVTAAVLIALGCAGDGCSADPGALAVVVVLGVGSAIMIGLAARQILRPRGGPSSTVAGRVAPRANEIATRPRDDPAGRLEAFLGRLDHLSTDELRLLAVRPLDPAAHEVARGQALAAVGAAGRAALLDEVTAGIATWLDRAFGTRSYDPTLAGLAWRHEPLRIEDRGRLRSTLDDAALAVAAADLIDEASHDELLGPCTMLADGGA